MKHNYYKLYKPYGYLSQFVNHQNKRRNKKLLNELSDFPEGTMAVGRLDEKSEGLLLLTTDGKFSNHITSSKIEKEYHVMVDGIITPEQILKLKNGFVREERHGPTSWLSITISEGKFRQVRKMTAKIGLPTLRLVRVRIGNYKLEDMTPSEVISFNY